ncbi:MalY/PatB family protein [Plantibacter sp. VKM Ac-2876]|uniref:MalY/PatB family protein n=1 Tax=Plantibacter sp. VKM Ac-2876 TaxID=2783826 RepID=UPI00188BBAF2|nr:aminotransferase class I/II-fold pyridoxal phosphate-dependent enzyme [Plantibacter sp. VKM Ac-2876]MBF4564888.1 aminotransferase class I/II-fold pyridoxal phosphate-dependent enzyme [Plantibacter sp. VKM Ac-2876]
MTEIVSADPLDVLRSRTSEKWSEYPDDVLPMFVAEMDVPLAPVIRDALHAAIDRGDAGYVASRTRLPQAFADFAARRWGWDVDPGSVFTTADVSMGIVEILRRVISPGEGVVITSPVYPPFFDLVTEAGGVVVDAPLLGSSRADDPAGGWRLDLDGLEAAFRNGAKAFLLCNPHNPIGRPHTVDELRSVAALAARYGVTVVSDEIHAPLTQPGERFVPYLSVSDEAAEHGYAVLSASKAWNLAGLKCAVMVTAGPGPRSVVAGMPVEVFWRTGQFGVLASVAAFEAGEPWLDGLLGLLDGNRRLLGELLGTELPEVGYRPPAAGYLAWLDCTALGWTEPPARRILREARVALQEGAPFGPGGVGHARLNLACSPELLTEAVGRISALR